MSLSSPTNFYHVFKNHDPPRVFQILTQSLNKLNQQRQVRLKWTKPDPKTLTVSFQTKLSLRSTNWAGSHGEARCVATGGGDYTGTKLQLSLVPAGSSFAAGLAGGGDGITVVARRGFDMGEREAIWNSIIKEVQSRL